MKSKDDTGIFSSLREPEDIRKLDVIHSSCICSRHQKNDDFRMESSKTKGDSHIRNRSSSTQEENFHRKELVHIERDYALVRILLEDSYVNDGFMLAFAILE